MVAGKPDDGIQRHTSEDVTSCTLRTVQPDSVTIVLYRPRSQTEGIPRTSLRKARGANARFSPCSTRDQQSSLAGVEALKHVKAWERPESNLAVRVGVAARWRP
jgi:hypothetical protein